MSAATGFERIAPFLQDPLVLAGFAIFLFFSFSRLLVQRGIIPRLPVGKGFAILKLVLTYGFLLGLVIIILGFGLKYREMSRAEQKRTALLIEGEVHANLKMATELALNMQTILGQVAGISDVLRRPEIPLLASLFPIENRALRSDNPQPLIMAREALARTKAQRQSLPETESARLAEMATAIRKSLSRTRTTISSLSDRDHKRYVFKSETWNANQPVLRKMALYDVGPLQETYARMPTLRTEYDIVVVHCIEFMDSLSTFFDPKNTDPQDQSLAAVLAHERKLFGILETFGSALTSEIESLITLRRELEAKARQT
jgi:hypothetical protein